jgi:hypothetical protein
MGAVVSCLVPTRNISENTSHGITKIDEIRDIHCCENLYFVLLRCHSVQFYGWLPKLWMSLLLPSSGRKFITLRLEVGDLFETSVVAKIHSTIIHKNTKKKSMV